MFDGIIAQHGTKFVIAALAVLLGLACLALVLWVVRRRPSSPFIRGGRNRQPRLSVLDAAAVDTRRRLVLVRRDDVEHLLMIGGPTDIVIETRIVNASSAEQAEQGAPALPQAGASIAEPSAVQSTAGPRPEAQVGLPPAASIAPPPPPRTAPSAHPAAAAVRPDVTAIPARADPVARSFPESSISSMGNVLYGDEPAPSRPAQGLQARPQPPEAPAIRAAPVSVPIPAPVQPPAAALNPSLVERNAIDALDRARDRVLTNPVGTGSERIGAHRDMPLGPETGLPGSHRTEPENAALVSEFEKILEAEIATSPRPVPASIAGLVAPTALQAPAEKPKSREETEAEMARLLGELSASRKS